MMEWSIGMKDLRWGFEGIFGSFSVLRFFGGFRVLGV